MKIEVRNTKKKINAPNKESRTVEGYAVLFDAFSEGQETKEMIITGAIDDAVIKRSNIFALLNFDDTRGILARSKYGKGTLDLTIDSLGLKYRFEAPHTKLGDELLEYLRRGDLDQSAFSYMVAEEEYDTNSDGSLVRMIKKIDQIFDISPVFDSTYSATTAALREKKIKGRLEKQHRGF